jgi:hypothetical protein
VILKEIKEFETGKYNENRIAACNNMDWPEGEKSFETIQYGGKNLRVRMCITG